MADDKRALGGDPRTPAHPAGDPDIPIGRILGSAFGLAALFALVGLVCWLVYTHYRRQLTLQDPPPSPIPEANAPAIPPEPRLQESPARDMAALRARESEILNSYGWVDRDAGVARIPIDRAMDLTLHPGLRPARPSGDVDGGAPDAGATDGGAP
jgi:hypothetical protein